MIIAGNNASVMNFKSQMNTEIAELEKNALDLALIGEFYYQNSKEQSVGEFFTKELLENYPNTMENGIYFLPYKIHPNQKISCIHAVWKNKQIELLPSCVSSSFDYFKHNEINCDMAWH